MSDDVQAQLHELLELAVIQGRIEGVTSAISTIGGFIDLVDRGTIGDDWLEQLRKLRDGMSTVVLIAEFENTERISRA